MSLTCTNCPDVVQALNLLALSNPRITHTAVDGALFPEEVARLNIQAVPAVFHGEELIHVGRGSLAELLDKLEEERFGTSDTGITPVVREYDLLVAGGGRRGFGRDLCSPQGAPAWRSWQKRSAGRSMKR